MVSVVSGMATATPTTCSAHRGIHRGSRFGHCSKIPNTSTPIIASVAVRSSSGHSPCVQVGRSSSATARASPSATASRRQLFGADAMG